jgi:hypothetical protein
MDASPTLRRVQAALKAPPSKPYADSFRLLGLLSGCIILPVIGKATTFRMTAIAPSTRPVSTGSPAAHALAWMPPKEGMEHPEWAIIGRRLGGISRCSPWWLGDWVRYGTSRWGEKYVEAARITGYDPRSLANMASIGSCFGLSRRRDNLTWSHHAAVAALEPGEQEEWLDRSTAERLSVSDLRSELRSARRGQGGQRPQSEGSRRQRSLEQPSALVCPYCGREIHQPSRAGETEGARP